MLRVSMTTRSSDMPKPKESHRGTATGPKPETLRIEGDWKDAVGHALKRGKPPGKEPKSPRPKKKRKK